MEKRDIFSLLQLTFAQKLNLMETIWDDLARNEKKLELPLWYKEVLKDREKPLYKQVMLAYLIGKKQRRGSGGRSRVSQDT